MGTAFRLLAGIYTVPPVHPLETGIDVDSSVEAPASRVIRKHPKLELPASRGIEETAAETVQSKISLAHDESLILSGQSICQYANDENMGACWSAVSSNQLLLHEVNLVLQAVKTIRSPIWMDYLCIRCKFWRGKI